MTKTDIAVPVYELHIQAKNAVYKRGPSIGSKSNASPFDVGN